MTTGLPNHVHISEREADGTWEDCTWDSGLEWFRDCYDPRKPATHAEAQLLRRASGEPATGGSNLGNLADGIRIRYGVTIPARISARTILSVLTPGKAAVVQGSMSAFGPTHRLSVYDRNFDGAHAVYIANVGGKYLWCDPEAPTTANVPVEVSAAEITKFVNAFAGQAVVATVRQPATATGASPMYPIIQYLPGHTATIKVNSNIRSEPKIASTKFRTTTAEEKRVLIGTVKGDVDPANGSNVWYMWWVQQSARYEFTAKDNVTSVQAPANTPDDGYTKATQDAAVAAQKAADAVILRDEKAKTLADERARIRGVLGI